MPLVKRTLKIIAICLAVSTLLLLRRPPKPGNAAITGVEEELLRRNEVPRERLSVPKEEEVPKAPPAQGRGLINLGPWAEGAVRSVLQTQPAEETAAKETFEAVDTADTASASALRQEDVGAKQPPAQRRGLISLGPWAEGGTPVGVVDARSCVGLNYNQIMQGSVSTRMVWNGHTFVPQKVCVVKEGDSVASVWSFEQSSSAVLSELRTGSKTP